MISRDDAQLIDVLQIAPRAPWATVGEHLGISACDGREALAAPD